jgi:hypothetical protein
MKVLMFVPFANIWVHSALEASLGEDWKMQGAEILMVRCSGAFQSACPAIDESGLSPSSPIEDRERTCSKCKLRRRNIDSEYGFTSTDIDGYLTPADHEEVNAILDSARVGEWEKLVVDDFEVGKFAAYEFFLRNKLDSTQIPFELWQEYKGHLRSTLFALRASRKILESHKPDLVIVHNELYGVNNVVAKTARARGIPVRHLGIGLEVSKYGSSLSLFKDADTELNLSSSKAWQEFKSSGTYSLDLVSFVNSMRFRSRGQSAFTYSSRSKRRNESQVRKKLGICANKPTILFVTSSSDERFAADLTGTLAESIAQKDTKNFKNLEQYLKELIDVFRCNSDLQLIVRIHPRMLPNKRDGVQSGAAVRLLELLTNLPSNVIVNWPDQDLSLFEVAQISNVSLNISSSAGLELLSLGLPVGVYEPERLFAYPREFNVPVIEGEKLGHYVRRISSASWDILNVKNAVLYRTFLIRVASVDLSTKLPDRTRWSWLRALNGLDLRTRLPVPSKLLRTLERIEMRRTRRMPAIGLEHSQIADESFQNIECRGSQLLHQKPGYQDLNLALHEIYRAIYGSIPTLGRQLLIR